MRVAIVGPRDLKLTDTEVAYAIYQSGFDVTHILTGDAKGVDAAVVKYAKSIMPNNYKVFEALWKTHGKAAGPYRNWFMINKGGGAQALIAFVRKGTPCSSGTASSIAEGVIKGIPVHIVKV